jgi:hypothetical protein
MGITDVTGVAKIVSKIIDAVSSATGTLYEPRKIRNAAKAKADSNRILSRETAESEVDTTLLLASQGIMQTNNDRVYDQEMLQRAANRFRQKVVDGQQNIDNITEIALQNTVDVVPDKVTDEELDKDWSRRFFSYAEDVSDEGMQGIWGKILAGEVAVPGTYSLSLLELLRRTDKKAAELFMKLLTLTSNDGFIVYGENKIINILSLSGLAFPDLLCLIELGFVGSQLAGLGAIRSNKNVIIPFNGIRLLLSGDGLDRAPWPGLLLTTAGIELSNILKVNYSLDYLKKYDEIHKKRAVQIKIIPPDYVGDIPVGAISTFKDLSSLWE